MITKYLLIMIMIKPMSLPLEYVALAPEPFATMEECFHERDAVVKKIGRPIHNYQAICVSYDAHELEPEGMKPEQNLQKKHDVEPSAKGMVVKF